MTQMKLKLLILVLISAAYGSMASASSNEREIAYQTYVQCIDKSNPYRRSLCQQLELHCDGGSNIWCQYASRIDLAKVPDVQIERESCTGKRACYDWNGKMCAKFAVNGRGHRAQPIEQVGAIYCEYGPDLCSDCAR
jgi:hypothetical protein